MENMYLEIKEIKEYRQNGSLSYEDTIAYIDEKYVGDTTDSIFHLSNVRRDFNGRYWIRMRHSTKYNEDGTIRWSLKFNSNGKLIKEDNQI